MRRTGIWRNLRASMLVPIAAVAMATGVLVPVASILAAGPNDTPILTSAASRKVHAAAGTFDLALALTPANPTTEPRLGPAQTIVFVFDKPVTSGIAVVTEGTATLGTVAFGGNEIVVPLTGVANLQYVTVAVTGVVAADGGTGGSGAVRVGYLAGDVSQNRAVSLSDLGQVNAQISQLVTGANFLKDVNASGTLSLTDKGLTNVQVTKVLAAVPTPANMPPQVNAGANQTVTLPASANLNGSGSDDSQPGPLVFAWSKVSGPGTVSFGNPAAVATSASFGAAGVYVLRLTTTDGVLNNADDVTITVDPVNAALPPDPATVAPPVSPTVATSIATGTAFLYTGADPIQTGVAPGTIVARRAAVLRGRVLTRDGSALPGVTISVLDHPELGQTLSRADVMFDLAVNGGASLTVSYAKAGLLPAQRQIDAQWQAYAVLPDVALIPLDAQVTVVDLTGAAPLQTARGSVMSDADGSRQATLLIPTGTLAQMVLADGTTQPITSLSLRATEYTVGPNGPKAMPAALPPSSGYTYAVELSADEAIAAGAKEITFSAPVPFYVENFVGFPVASLVPTGFYDRSKGQWVPSDNGRVIKVLGVTGGLADLDLDGSGAAAGAAALAALGITAAERQRLATLYAPGRSLWRVLLAHLTPWDCNWPFGPPPGSKPPSGSGKPKPGPKPDKTPKDGPNKDCGSIIGCEPQTLGEVVSVTGAPFRLHYQSDRMPARAVNRLKIQLSGDTLPAGVQRIHLEVIVAGRTFKSDFAPQANLVDTFNWDGKDAYDRPVQGRQQVNVRIGYQYVMQYYATADTFAASFNRFAAPPTAVARSGGGGGGGGGAVIFSFPGGRSSAPPMILWEAYQASLGSLRSTGVGGWSPSVHHAYDVAGRTLYLGNGDQRSAASVAVVSTAAGTGVLGIAGDGGPATQAQLTSPAALAVGPDGSVYIVAEQTNRVQRVGPDGIIGTVAGTGTPGFSGDGGPAIQAQLNNPSSIAVGPDGSVYIGDNDTYNKRVRRVAPDGIITSVVGTGSSPYQGDGGLATKFQLTDPRGLAVGPDGTLYVSEGSKNQVRRVGPDGVISLVAGTGNQAFAGDGGLATAAGLASPWGLALGPDGSVYIADTGSNRIRRVAPDGIITTVAGVAGGTPVPGFAGDGGPATLAKLNFPHGIAMSPDGSLFVVETGGNRVRRIAPDGIITTVAGTGVYGPAGDGGLATQMEMRSPGAIAIGSVGTLYIGDGYNYRVRQIDPSLPGYNAGELHIAAEDGSELYLFDANGRHLRTYDTLTGAVRFQFAYDGAERLAAITDVDGNVTAIERDGSGNPSGVTAPFGQHTSLAVQGDGYLSIVANPAGEVVQLSYGTGAAKGLLATLTDPRGNVHRYLYDAVGRLVRDESPAGGVKTLARTDVNDDRYTVTLTTAAGLVTTYEFEELPTGSTRRLRTDPSGAGTESLIGTDGSRQVTYPDGTVANLVEGPDPRFRMQSPIVKSLTVTTPGGITSTRSSTRTATVSDPQNLLSLIAQTDTVTINGKTYTTSFAAATRKVTATSPAGRQHATTLNAQGRVTEQQDDVGAGLEPRKYTYDAYGRLTKLAQGTQSWTYGYDAQGRLTSRQDAAGGALAFAYDAADRVSAVTMPGGQQYGFAYDASGNRTAVTMPSLGIHLLDYSAAGEEGGYAPPGNSPYVTGRDTDGRVNQVILPTGRTQTFTYDGGSRFVGIGYPEATLAFTYAAGDFTNRIGSLARTPTGAGPAQQIQFSYSGRLLTGMTMAGAANGQYAYTYDSNLLLKSMVLGSGPDNVTTLFTRDIDGLRTGVGPFAIARAGPLGAPSQIGDGTLDITQTYDALGRVAVRTHAVGGQQKYRLQLAYDSVGRISGKLETVAGVLQTRAYAYGADSQLSEARREGVVTELYAYDANRNRSSRKLGANPVEPATYDGQDRLQQQGAIVYQFNADGFLTQRDADTFQYSTTGELLEAVAGGQAVTYAYDGLRRRVSRTDVGGTTQYLYGNPGNELQLSNSRSPAGTLTTYYYDEGQRLFALQRGAARYYVATDQLGSPRVVTDSAGALVKVVEYDGFGNVAADSNPGFDLAVGFGGGLADGATGLVRFGLRDYDPIAGRWTARDPALFSGAQANLYVYANNNPVSLVDSAGFGSAGVGLCDGVCVGLKLGYVEGVGISACFELGFGTGNSVDVDPFGALDETGLSTEAKVALKAGIAKAELGVEVPVGPCAGFAKAKPKTEGCIGPFCLNSNGESKGSLDFEEGGILKNPFKGGGVGWEGKGVAKVCQQAKW